MFKVTIAAIALLCAAGSARYVRTGQPVLYASMICIVELYILIYIHIIVDCVYE